MQSIGRRELHAEHFLQPLIHVDSLERRREVDLVDGLGVGPVRVVRNLVRAVDEHHHLAAIKIHRFSRPMLI